MKRLIEQNSDYRSNSRFKKTLASIIENYISALAQEAYSYSQADRRKTLRMEDLKEAKDRKRLNEGGMRQYERSGK
ncbi:MAG: histone-like protein [Thermoplasmata archaeon]